jgi:hypothetical protein
MSFGDNFGFDEEDLLVPADYLSDDLGSKPNASHFMVQLKRHPDGEAYIDVSPAPPSHVRREQALTELRGIHQGFLDKEDFNADGTFLETLESIIASYKETGQVP